MSEKNVVYEWATKIKDAANNGYYGNSEEYKDICFGVIIGICEAILCAIDSIDVEPLRRCADCQHFRLPSGRYICEVTLQEIDKDMVAIDPEGNEPDCLSFKEREDENER